MKNILFESPCHTLLSWVFFLCQTDHSSKHYCYQVAYLEYDDSMAGLVVNTAWTWTACCSIAKNGTVMGSFLPLVQVTSSTGTSRPGAFEGLLNCFRMV